MASGGRFDCFQRRSKMRKLIDIVRTVFAESAGLFAYFAAIIVGLILFSLLAVAGLFAAYSIVPETQETVAEVVGIVVILGTLGLSLYLAGRLSSRLGFPLSFLPTVKSANPRRGAPQTRSEKARLVLAIVLSLLVLVGAQFFYILTD